MLHSPPSARTSYCTLHAVLRMAGMDDVTGKPELSGKGDLNLMAAMVKATFGIGALHMSLGDLDTARAMYEQSLALSRVLEDKQGMASALNTPAIVAHQQGDYDTARDLHEQSLALRRELGDKWGIALTLNNLGIVAHFQGEYDVAWDLHEQGLALRREVGDKRGVASSLENLGGCVAATLASWNKSVLT